LSLRARHATPTGQVGESGSANDAASNISRVPESLKETTYSHFDVHLIIASWAYEAEIIAALAFVMSKWLFTCVSVLPMICAVHLFLYHHLISARCEDICRIVLFFAVPRHETSGVFSSMQIIRRSSRRSHQSSLEASCILVITRDRLISRTKLAAITSRSFGVLPNLFSFVAEFLYF
jgi:hypothetical protein